MENKIRRQHYVWREYLRSWATNDIIYCCRNGKIFTPNLMGVAQKRDFYRLKVLTEDDVFWIKTMLIKGSPEFIQPFHNNLLKMFLTPFRLINELRQKGFSGEEFDKRCDVLINNTEEKLHGYIERSAIRILNELRAKKQDIFNTDDGKMNFFRFINTQYFRTNKMKSNLLKSFSNGLQSLKGAEIPRELEGKEFNPDNIRSIMNHIFAANLAHSQFIRNYRIIFILNETSLPFITSDQPIINIYAIGKPLNQEVHELAYYYPITPKISILITEDNMIQTTKVILKHEKEVNGYNLAIISEAKEQIYSNLEDVLKKYLN